ncbi:MAG: ATP-dependent Clp protease adapter ClpS [SAR324 cluster bacterium]|uniref:ATP-dependent Clp protease adapter protein ClpS n=1 Tax=SAR324 cluster bacterium TaxID=2024889 RepID=A0A2A4T8P6_9DELT|nr:MAG: ATP-dependent Clp protease adapter ClpS [SAR324 cluster bacterium]
MAENLETGSSGEISTEEIVKLKPPQQYKVILHNDDYTPMEFVIEILMVVFKRDETKATEIMLNVHQKGQGICGVYTYEIAESKVMRVQEMARQYEYPLQATLEEE